MPLTGKADFPQVFIQGGFDVVIGNPPYGDSYYTIEKSKYLEFGYYKSI